jgi:hypothetical protein
MWRRWSLIFLLVVLLACTPSSRSAPPEAVTSPKVSVVTSPGLAEQAPPPAGDPTWRITRLGSEHAIEGWADRTSVLPGSRVGVHVSTTGRSWRLVAYRMGWYGGALAHMVWRSDAHPGVRHTRVGPAPGTNTVWTTWPVSLTLSTAGWLPGAYLLRLDSDVGQRYIPLTVRSPDTAGRIVLINAVTTWQAYNAWGGYNAYHGPGGLNDFDDRARVVSFDRPYQGDGSADFIGLELPVLAHAERLGLDLAYATDIDLHELPHLLRGARAVISLGHDEYWSSAMRTAVTRARDAGTNVAFLGANAVFRQIRMAASRIGPDRLEINYKRTSDPLYGINDREVTVDWREPPLSDPESSLTGTFYECNPVRADMIITDPGNWLFAGTGATRGMHLRRLIGPEYDRVNPAEPTPAHIEVLTHSAVRCRGVPSYADSAYYTVASGAGVFASGTSAFIAGLPEAGATGRTAAVIGGELSNLLRAFARGPARLTHPAHGNLASLHEYAGDPIADSSEQ